MWQADDGALRPMVEPTGTVSDTCEDLWLRPKGAEPWEYDVMLMHASSTTWTYKRDRRISLPLSEILWARDGITHLRPEVQLLHRRLGSGRGTRSTSKRARLCSSLNLGPGSGQPWAWLTRVILGWWTSDPPAPICVGGI